MRILRLDLIRYGPFTDKVLTFRRDAKLHLVFGPNEAGKSSSLAAIGDLLFGFAREKQFDFVHEAETLRIGAEIEARDGTALSFRRRRGTRNSLLADDADETPLQDDVLAPFVGMLGREVFSRAFGLNSETLREGGEAMLESEGEMGAALFAAASGLTGLARIRRRLEDEADAIYSPRVGKDRRFYQALDRYQAAITAERANELKAGDWKQLVGEIAEIERQLGAIRAQRAATAAALARLQRLRVLGPIVGAIDALEQELDAFADLPEVPGDFVGDSLKALDVAEGTAGLARAADEDYAAATAALEAIAFDKAILVRADAVMELFSRKGDYLSKLAELPRLELEHDELNSALADLAQRLGFGDPDDMVAALPSDALLETGRSLIEQGMALEQAVDANETRLGEELASISAAEAGGTGSISDPKPFRDQLAALAPDLKQLEDQSYLETSLRTLMQKLNDGALRLVPPVADIELLVSAGLPSRDTVMAHKAAFERLVVERREEALKLEANARETQETQQKLTETERSGPVAYEETIKLMRADREASLEELRQHLLRTGRLMTPQEVSERLMRYEEEVAEADSIADQAIADARRISRLADYRERLIELTVERPRIERRLDALSDEQARAAQAYARLFEGAGIIPLGPDAMVGWLAAVDDLMAVRRDIEALQTQIDNLTRLGSSIHKALLNIAKAIGVAGPQALPALALSRLVSTTLDEMSSKWQARLSFEGARQAARMRVGQVEDALSKANRDHLAWRHRFEALLPVLKLAPDTTTAGAQAALAVWAGVPEASRQRAAVAARLTAAQRDVKNFEKDVVALARERAPKLINLPAQALIDVLRERAEAARAGKARHDDARQRLEAAAERSAAARAAHAASANTLRALGALLPEGADARTQLARLERRNVLRAQLAERRAAFEAAAEGVPEASIRADLPDFDRATAQLDAEDLERRSDALHIENNKLYAQLGQRQARREALEAGTGSELAAFERQSAEAEIVSTARQWAVRKIAATMLAAAIERHREAQSDPLLVRAGTLFRTLTGGAFADLVQDYGEDDQPRLVGLRRSGERVGIAGMSEGTRDQLYLALRLAYIEDYADRTEPMPFIGDDIFQTFDDDRTAAGIKAFAGTSALFQPILFTHHQSVVALARRALGEDLDYIEL